jgi:hypothetical protein
MSKCWVRLPLVILLAFIALAEASHAATGFVRVSFGKAGLIVGAGAGRGVITYDGHDYRFRISGLSLGLAAGLSVTRVVGWTSDLHRVSDFAGTYTAVGLGGAWAAGTGRVKLKNDKGVIVTLEGTRAGLELAANLIGFSIVFEQPVN